LPEFDSGLEVLLLLKDAVRRDDGIAFDPFLSVLINLSRKRDDLFVGQRFGPGAEGIPMLR